MKAFPPFNLDTENQCLWRLRDREPAERVLMTPKAFALLAYLVDRAGQLVTHGELLDAVWSGTVVEPQAVKKHILSVRSALGDRPRNSAFIETVTKRGYRFIAPVSDSSNAAPVQRSTRGVLAGRASALEELRQLWRVAARGERQIVFITGEPGIGKTALAGEFAHELAATELSLRIASGQCIEGYGSKEPYGPMLDALGRLCRGPHAEPVVRALADDAPTWLVQLPGVVRPEHRQTLQRELLGATRERMLREICEALESISAQIPLLIELEDLHWADTATVDLIFALARRRIPAKLMLVCTSRGLDEGPPGHPMKALMPELVAHRLCRELELNPLTESDVEDYLNAQSSPNPAPPGLSGLVHQRSEGNPLFMVAALEHMAKHTLLTLSSGRWQLRVPLEQIEFAVPDDLRLMIEARLERLSPQERHALEFASVAPTSFSARLLSHALGLDPTSVENLLDDLARVHRVIRWVATATLPDGALSERYEFVHALYRQVLYERQLPGRRAAIHRLHGKHIAAIYAERIEEVAPELAYHFEQAADWSRSIEYLTVAADLADRRLAHQEAVVMLSRALELVSKLPEEQRASTETDLLTALASDRLALFDPGALGTYETLAARAGQYGLVDVQVRALMDLSFYLALSSGNACLDAAKRALSLSAKQDPKMSVRTRAACAFRRLAVRGWNPEDVGEFTAAHGVAGASIPARRSDLVELSLFLWLSGKYRDGLQLAMEFGAKLFEGAQTPQFIDIEQVGAAIASNRLFLGDWGAALDGLSLQLAGAQKNENYQRLLWLSIMRAWVHLHALDYKGVIDICASVAPFLREPKHNDTSDVPATVTRAQVHMARICVGSASVALGDTTQAMEQLSRARKDMACDGVFLDWYWRMQLELALTQHWLANDDLASAQSEAAQLLGLALRTVDRTWHGIAWEISARVALATGDQDRALDYITTAVSTVEGFEVPLAAWQVHATAADINMRLGRRTASDSHRDASRVTILRLADSLAGHETLRETFLNAPAVSDVLDGRAHSPRRAPD